MCTVAAWRFFEPLELLRNPYGAILARAAAKAGEQIAGNLSLICLARRKLQTPDPLGAFVGNMLC